MNQWLPPRLRPLLGQNLDAVTESSLQNLIGLPEDTDLEFKREPWGPSEGQVKECALDIADKANAGGGLIVIGVEEGPDKRASGLVPMPDEGGTDQGLRVHHIVARRISPPPAITHRAISVGAGSVHLFSVAPTTMPPYGVDVGENAFRFPVRSGLTRRYLTEPEIAGRYQQRFRSAMDQRQRLVDLRQGGLSLIPADYEEVPAWLLVAAVPEFAGHLQLSRALIGETQAWLQPALAEFDLYRRPDRLTVRTRFRAMWASDSSAPGRDLYSQACSLGLGGDGYVLLGHFGGGSDFGPPADAVVVYDEFMIADLVNAIGVLARHAQRAGAVGHLSFAAQIVSSQPAVLGHPRGYRPGRYDSGVRVTATGWSEHDVPLDDVAAAGVERLALARLLALDLFSAFGMAEVAQIAEGPALSWQHFGSEAKRPVEQWARTAGVPIVGKPDS